MENITKGLAEFKIQHINNLVRLSELKLRNIVAPDSNYKSIQSNYKDFIQLDTCLMSIIRNLL